MRILDMIDGALADYEASGDAMRWVPEEKRETRPEWASLFAGIDAAGLAAALEASDRLTANVAEGVRRTRNPCWEFVKSMAPVAPDVPSAAETGR